MMELVVMLVIAKVLVVGLEDLGFGGGFGARVEAEIGTPKL